MSDEPIVVSAVALIDGDGRMVTVRKRDTTRFMNPGGKPEPGESPVAAAVRELHEELGVVLRPSELLQLGTWSAPAANEPGRTVTAFAFRAALPDGVEPRPQAEIVEVHSVNPDDVAALPDEVALSRYAPLLVERFVPALLTPERRVGFLHTSQRHVATFDRLCGELLPGVSLVHLVDADLLDKATAGEDVRDGIAAHLTRLQAAGADHIVCTCSTLGPIAEAPTTAVDVPVFRVDRSMAERAARHDGRVLAVIAVEATREPTERLLLGSGVPAERLTVLLDHDAWPLFLNGDLAGYHGHLAATVRRAVSPGDLVVLGQVSMAPVAELLDDLGVPVISSPRMAVEHLAVLSSRPE